MSDLVFLSAPHREIVREVLRSALPPSARVWVFGSRAKGTARPKSDLDLAIDVGRSLSLGETATLVEAFDESDLPYRVDVVDLHAVDAEFAKRIDEERVSLELG